MKNQILKEKLVGKKVDIVDDKTIISADENGKQLVVQVGSKILRSRYYDDINVIVGTDRSIVRIGKLYHIIKGVTHDKNNSIYEYLGNYIKREDGKYNIISILVNGICGVIDIDENIVIPFNNSKIEIKTINGKIVYVAESQYAIKMYTEKGQIIRGLSAITNYPFIIFNEGVLSLDRVNRDNILFDVKGNQIFSGKLVSKEYNSYELVNNNGSIVLTRV